MSRETVTVELDEGIAWVTLDRPEKRNAMNPRLNAEMVEVLLELDADDRCGVLVLTGAGDSFSAGMDLKEYFREVDAQPEHVQRRVRRDAPSPASGLVVGPPALRGVSLARRRWRLRTHATFRR